MHQHSLKSIWNIGGFTRLILTVLACNLVFLVLILLIADYTGIGPTGFYKDPNVVARQFFAIGLMSNIGAIGWVAAAGIALFTSIVKLAWSRRDRDAQSLFLLGLLTAWLGLDDLLMIHDGLAVYIGVPEQVFLFIEALLGLAWIASAARTTSSFHRDVLLLILAFTSLGASLLLDQIMDMFGFSFRGMGLLEDVFKLIGITFWALYTIRLSVMQIVILKP